MYARVHVPVRKHMLSLTAWLNMGTWSCSSVVLHWDTGFGNS